MTDEPIVIVDAEGREHEFPAGTDPRRAGAIVRARTASTGWALPGPAGTASGDPEADALSRFAGQHPKAAAAVAGAGMAAPLVGLGVTAVSPAATMGILRTAGAGAIPGATIGAAQGLMSGGPIGALRGGARGAISGAGAALGARGAVGILRTGGAAAQGAAAGSAAEALRQFGNRQILTPQEQAMKDALMARAKREAVEAGTINAGTQAREPGFLESLFR